MTGRHAATTLAPMSQPAGWYPHRDNPTLEIYWDGYNWVNQTRWAAGSAPNATVGVQVLAWFVAVCTVGYMLPWAIATARQMPNHWATFTINLLLGWTVIGWIVALAMALGNPHR